MTLRAPRRAAEYFKSRDADTAITEHFIRRLINDGDIPVIKNGVKCLVDCDYIEKLMADRLRG